MWAENILLRGGELSGSYDGEGEATHWRDDAEIPVEE